VVGGWRASQLLIRTKTSSVTAASPAATDAGSPFRGDQSVPVWAMRGRTHTVSASTVGTRPTHRESDTITCVAPIAPRAKATGTASLMPPSVSRHSSPLQTTGTGGKSRGIDAEALTRSASAGPRFTLALK
jgi:hypothetical protein